MHVPLFALDTLIIHWQKSRASKINVIDAKSLFGLKQTYEKKLKLMAIIIALMISVLIITATRGFQPVSLISKEVFEPIRVTCVGAALRR